MSERAPFRYELADPGFVHDGIYSFGERPELIVRCEVGDGQVAAFLKNPIRENWQRLRDCGINIPPADIVIGEATPKEYGVYILTERVVGTNLEDALTERTVPVDDVDRLFAALWDYYGKCHRNDYWFDYDIRNEQFLYGVRPGECEPRIYLVDLDASVAPPFRVPQGKCVDAQIRKLRFEMDCAELALGAKLLNARQVQIEFLDSLPDNEFESIDIAAYA